MKQAKPILPPQPPIEFSCKQKEEDLAQPKFGLHKWCMRIEEFGGLLLAFFVILWAFTFKKKN